MGDRLGGHIIAGVMWNIRLLLVKDNKRAGSLGH